MNTVASTGPHKVKTSTRIGKFAIIGVILALFNFLIYTFLARVIINSNDLLWVDSIISYIFATFLAFFLHSKITWKERPVSKLGTIMFFVWNGLTALLINPFFTWLFYLMTPIYEFAFNISSAIHLPFDYDFIESTGIFCLTTCVTMILNFIFYDKLVFDDLFVKNLFKKFKKPTKKQLFSFLLYLLPILFAIITVFFITTSGEDNFQGAGNFTNGIEINSAQDAVNAFNYNSRIADMYSWTVIDYYDNQYSFGLDTIFRIIDAITITAVFYIATYIILGRKPQLKIHDAIIFCLTFFAFIVTPFGRSFYYEFSMIHNYVPLALITLLFSIPYINFVIHKPQKTKRLLLFPITMFLAGIIFGMSTTITPLAFIGTVIVYTLLRHRDYNKPPLWFYAGLTGIVTGFLFCWFAGNGINHYTSTEAAEAFDYVALNDIFKNIPQIVSHIFHNFTLVLIPFIFIIIACVIFTKNPKKNLNIKSLKALPSKTKDFILILTIFIIVHLLGATLIKSPSRLLIPVYFACIILSFSFFKSYIRINKPFIAITTIAVASTVIVHGFLLIKYRQEMSIILNNIKSTPESTICISPNDTLPTRIPLIDLAQANMIVDWGEPEPILKKEIINCE